MNKNQIKIDNKLTEHLFRTEYGKIVSVIIKYLGVGHLKLAEDITQETFYKAVKYWQLSGIPPNPKAWLYVTAKNECLNTIKRTEYQRKYKNEITRQESEIYDLKTLDFSDQVIIDDQLRMMFVCCNKSISKDAQLCLILKILCGFSISEIANALLTPKETINKRLVRGRRKLREIEVSMDLPDHLESEIPTILEAIYLLFNEGYSPSEKNKLVRHELCFEAIRLGEILKDNPKITNIATCHALLSLMYLNASRFDARMNENNEAIEMKNQDRKRWNQDLINKGIHYLNKAIEDKAVSTYHILAAISANHCIAPNFENTNWAEILSLYDSLLNITDSPLIRLNRSVALAMVKGNQFAIDELIQLNLEEKMDDHYLFHSTIAEFYIQEDNLKQSENHLQKAIALAKNQRDIGLLKKKLSQYCP